MVDHHKGEPDVVGEAVRTGKVGDSDSFTKLLYYLSQYLKVKQNGHFEVKLNLDESTILTSQHVDKWIGLSCAVPVSSTII